MVAEVLELRRSYATVIPEHGNPRRLKVAARTGDVIQLRRLTVLAPDYELARLEAQQLFPDRLIVVPMLGEKIPNIS